MKPGKSPANHRARAVLLIEPAGAPLRSLDAMMGHRAGAG